MAKTIKQKEKSFGTVTVNHMTPAAFPETAPKAVNMVIDFEEALKLYFGIGQCLAKLNSYDRSTKLGRKSALNLCLFIDKSRISITESQIRES